MKIKIGYVSDYRNLKKVSKDLRGSSFVSVDCETNGLDPYSSHIRLLQVASADAAWILDMQRLPKKAVLEEILMPVFPNKGQVKIMHNAKFDLKMIQSYFGYGLREIEMLFDTYIAVKLLHGGENIPASLDWAAENILGVHLDKSFQTFNWAGTLYKEPVVYAGLDAAALLPLYRYLCQALSDNKLLKVARMEFECVPAVAQMELNGFKIDQRMWLSAAEVVKEDMIRGEIALREYLGDDISLGSNKQVAKRLSEITGMEITSVDKDHLKELIKNYYDKPDLFGKVVDYRPAIVRLQDYNHLKSQYTRFGPAFLKHVNPVTGRVHSSLSQIDTRTMRFSSSDPNIQNISRDSVVRDCFVPEQGNRMWIADYSQIELRAMAFFTKDEGYMYAFENGIDLHAQTASEVFGIVLEAVTKEQRQTTGKTINFGLPYGMGAPGYAAKTDLPINRAKADLKRFYDAHPQLTEWHQQQFEYFERYGCVRSASGRLRALTNWRHNRHFSEQAAKNFPIQSSSADITKLAMTRCFKELPEQVLLVNSVHDELVHEMPADMVDEYGPKIDQIMIESAQFLMPGVCIEVEGHAADKWSK